MPRMDSAEAALLQQPLAMEGGKPGGMCGMAKRKAVLLIILISIAAAFMIWLVVWGVAYGNVAYGTEKKWSFQTSDNVCSSPALGADGTVYVGSYDGRLYAVTAGGALKWSYLTDGMVSSSPTLGADGTV